MPSTSAVESILSLIDREIWIVTAADGERRGGLVATWVSQASLDIEQPLMLIALARNHFTAELVDASGAFAVHLLSEQHMDVAANFALGSGRDRDKFAQCDYSTRAGGSPVLDRCLAWIDCRVFARLDAGDRIYFWGDVLDAQRREDAKPLTEHGFFSLATEDQVRELAAALQRDLRIQQPMLQDWKHHLPDALRPRN